MRKERIAYLLTVALLFACLFASSARATYNTATVVKNEPLPDGRTRLFVSFTGNAGETPVMRDIYIGGGTTVAMLKRWVIEQANDLNGTRSLGTSAGLQVGQVLDLTPVSPLAPTAKENFAADIRLLQQMANAIALGIKTAADADYVAQKTKVQTALNSNPSWINAF